MPRKPKYMKNESYSARREGLERPHTIWIRDDLWVAIKRHKLALKKEGKSEKEYSIKNILETAVYEYLLRKDVEKRTGMEVPFDESIYDKDSDLTRHQFEMQ
jgi:hypothetical protein